MGDSHSKSFFGQNAGLFLSSSSKSDPFFFMRVIKKKPNGSWEKPSKGEGKVIKFSLEEMVMILQVLNRKLLNWKSFHTYRENKTPISFTWEDEKAKTLWINIDQYSKMLNFSQAEILRMLVEHILEEKIKFATLSNNNRAPKSNSKNVKGNDFNHSESIIEFNEDFNHNQFEEEIDNSNHNHILTPPKTPLMASQKKRVKLMGV